MPTIQNEFVLVELAETELGFLGRAFSGCGFGVRLDLDSALPVSCTVWGGFRAMVAGFDRFFVRRNTFCSFQEPPGSKLISLMNMPERFQH